MDLTPGILRPLEEQTGTLTSQTGSTLGAYRYLETGIFSSDLCELDLFEFFEQSIRV